MLETFKIKYKDLAKIKKLPPRDQGHYLPFNSYPHGAPLGGFGAGTIGRSPYGDFNIWHIKVGAHIEEELKSCCFHCYQKNLRTKKITTNILTARDFQDKKLSSFARPINAGKYQATYPKSKYIFGNKKSPLEITCEQFSPVLPHNYQETSYPVAIFNHTVKNNTKDTIEVSLMLSWANMTGWQFEDKRPGIQDNWFSFIKANRNKKHFVKKARINNQQALAIVMGQDQNKAQTEMDGEIALATIADKNAEISFQEYFYLEGNGQELYKQFGQDGTLNNAPPNHMLDHQNYGSAIAVKIKLKPYEKKSIPFILVWDLPIVNFGKNINHYKYYTKFFGKSGKHSWKIAQTALKKHQEWSVTIDDWHQDIVRNSKLNKYIKNIRSRNNYYTALINELYFLADGGSFWDAQTGNFGLLECFDYPFYETIDVRFYGSFPLLKFWPQIELQIMKNFSKTISQTDKQKILYNTYADNPDKIITAQDKKNKLFFDVKKIKGACPHDLGSPKKDPFKKPDDYTWQNTNYWKDLNTKFVLLIYRDFLVTKNKQFLKSCWSAMKTAINYLHQMDKDGDSIPENEGYPDQTYDNWIMKGASAYCGTLWLAAVQAMQELALLLKDKQAHKKYQGITEKAKTYFIEKLWRNKYFVFCEDNNAIMSDQLIGQWYLDIFDKPSIVERKLIQKALKTIYKYNFRKTAGGRWGVISGKKPNNRHVDSEQGRDVWVGANYALCSLLVKNGHYRQAEKIINTLTKIIYGRGFFFRTPEGWDTKGNFTATMYMRPNSIWALEI